MLGFRDRDRKLRRRPLVILLKGDFNALIERQYLDATRAGTGGGAWRGLAGTGLGGRSQAAQDQTDQRKTLHSFRIGQVPGELIN